ncbi:sterol desaturase family protein [Aquimarina sp. TRL1]|uniref:sterol desaturase family protein n=1 Tax=Aquimarina sp. (strain TRL1) TaxID=2736252 RepID=UPI00158A83BC|nr:sterol desaturase family protein [Aquimarina sp. TRL1]QKX06384.1 sterol desaturase family protein [Aquimarina sp. TRL1]
MNQAIQSFFGESRSLFFIVSISLIVLEWIILLFSKDIKSNKEGFVNILSYLLEIIPYTLLGKIVILGGMMWMYQYRLFTLGTEWYIWGLAYLLYDFMFYSIHVLGHKVRFFWCIHGVHHTVEEMKLTAAIRGSFIGFIQGPLTIIFIPLLGFDPFMVFIVESIARIYGLYEHIHEKFVGKQPWLEKIFITPSVHRVHHAKNHKYLDTNYGETFSFWDRIFGTFQTQLEDEVPEYGIVHDKINSENLWDVQFILWKDLWRDIKSAPRFIDKLKYIVMYPGWNHIDGGKKASKYRNDAWESDVKQKEATQILLSDTTPKTLENNTN